MGVPVRKGDLAAEMQGRRHEDTQGEGCSASSHMVLQTALSRYPRQQKLEEAEGPSRELRSGHGRATPQCCTSSLEKGDDAVFSCLSHPVCDTLHGSPGNAHRRLMWSEVTRMWVRGLLALGGGTCVWEGKSAALTGVRGCQEGAVSGAEGAGGREGRKEGGARPALSRRS